MGVNRGQIFLFNKKGFTLMTNISMVGLMDKTQAS